MFSLQSYSFTSTDNYFIQSTTFISHVRKRIFQAVLSLIKDPIKLGIIGFSLIGVYVCSRRLYHAIKWTLICIKLNQMEPESIFVEKELTNTPCKILVEKARKVHEKLKSNPVPGIEFNFQVDKVITADVSNRNCDMSMALSFAKKYLKKRSNIQGSKREFIKSLKRNNSNYEKDSQKFYSVQSVYDTLTLNPQAVPKDYDFKRAKIEALAHANDLTVTMASESCGYNYADNKSRERIQKIATLLEGTYLIRLILLDKQQEKWGHSAIWINEKKDGFLYIPTQGLTKENKKYMCLPLYNLLETTLHSFEDKNIDIRFYKLEMHSTNQS